MTFSEAITEISEATGRKIIFQGLSLLEYTSMLKQFQVPEDVIWLANYLFSEVLDGRNASITSDVEKILGRKAKDFSDYVKETAETRIWN